MYLIIDPGPEAATYVVAVARVLKNKPAELVLYAICACG